MPTRSRARARARRPHGRATKPIRYAVIGLGHIAQVAILPAFAHAKQNSTLTALVSDDPQKLRELGRRYGVERLCRYEQVNELFASGHIDAVYIALPNSITASTPHARRSRPSRRKSWRQQ